MNESKVVENKHEPVDLQKDLTELEAGVNTNVDIINKVLNISLPDTPKNK